MDHLADSASQQKKGTLLVNRETPGLSLVVCSAENPHGGSVPREFCSSNAHGEVLRLAGMICCHALANLSIYNRYSNLRQIRKAMLLYFSAMMDSNHCKWPAKIVSY